MKGKEEQSMEQSYNSPTVIAACIALLNVETLLAEATEIETTDWLIVQQCSLEEGPSLLPVHGRHHHHHHPPYPPHHYAQPHYHPSIYPPPYPYYAPVSGICRN